MPTIQFSVVGVPCSSLAFRAFPIVLEQVGNEARSVTQGMKPCQRTVEWIAPSTVMGSKFCVWPVRPLLPLMFAYEFNECRSVRLPIHREAIEVFEDCIDAGLFKESDCVFGVFIEVSIEYPLVHEIRVATDVEEDPSQVVKLEWGENKRIASYSVLYFFPVRTDYFLAPRFDLCDDREAIIGRGLRKNCTVTPLLKLEISLLRDGHRRRFRPVARFSTRH